MSEKKPRLFFFDELECGAWTPAPDRVENIIDTHLLDDGEEFEVRFKRIDMTDEEFDALPEV